MADLVEPVPDCLLFDTAWKLTRADMALLWAAGFRGAIRYVGFDEQPSSEDLDAPELGGLLDTGFGVMVAQHVRNAGWMPSEARGTSDGTFGVRHALAAGLAQGTSFWDDLEGISGTAPQTLGYANQKLTIVKATFRMGEYIGDEVPLDGHELFVGLGANRYWRSASRVPDVERRGYCMVQMQTIQVGAVEVDVNYHRADKLGGRAMWMRRAG